MACHGTDVVDPHHIKVYRHLFNFEVHLQHFNNFPVCISSHNLLRIVHVMPADPIHLRGKITRGH